jgi:hypothetical protein
MDITAHGNKHILAFIITIALVVGVSLALILLFAHPEPIINSAIPNTPTVPTFTP